MMMLLDMDVHYHSKGKKIMSYNDMGNLLALFGILCAIFVIFGMFKLVNSGKSRSKRKSGFYGGSSSNDSWSSYISDSPSSSHEHDCSSHSVDCSHHG
jgi:hypothetical protein